MVGARRGGRERPRLVVPPRGVAVERGRHDQRRDGDPGGERRSRAGLGEAQALEPQEREHEQRQQRAAQELALEVERDGGHRVERHEQDERGEREAGGRAPRPERGQRREHGQHRAAERDHDPGPLVDPAVGHARARQRADAALDARRQGVPVGGPQHLVGDARGEEGEHDRRQAGAGHRRPAQRAVQPGRAEQGRHRQQAGADRGPGASRRGRLEHRHPVQGAERGEREVGRAAGERERQQRPGRAEDVRRAPAARARRAAAPGPCRAGR